MIFQRIFLITVIYVAINSAKLPTHIGSASTVGVKRPNKSNEYPNPKRHVPGETTLKNRQDPASDTARISPSRMSVGTRMIQDAANSQDRLQALSNVASLDGTDRSHPILARSNPVRSKSALNVEGTAQSN
jgi:hypothetical protein